MPAVIDADRNAKAMREAAENELKARRGFILQRRAYYNGVQREHLKMKDGINPNVVDNQCEIIVNATADFLAHAFPEIVAEDAEAATEFLRMDWSRMDDVGWLLGSITEGGIAGHVFSRVLEDGTVRNLDAANVIVWWNPDDYMDVWGYELQWGNNGYGDTTHRQDILPDMDEDGNLLLDAESGKPRRWWIVDYQRGGSNNAAMWEPSGEDVMWDYPLSPIVDWGHLPIVGHSYYGQTELPDHALKLQDQINKITTDIGQIIRFYAYPSTVVTGVDEEEQEKLTQVGGMYVLSNEKASVYNVEMQSELVATRAERDSLKSALLRRSRVVVLPDDLNAFRGVTNLGIRTLYMPQTSKANTLKRRYGDGIEAISRRKLMLANVAGWQDMKLATEWGSALPTDEREEIQTLQMLRAMGVISKRMIAERLGYNYDLVREDLLEEAMESAVLVDGTANGSMDVMR